jgi:hypothetical protein
MIRRKSFSLTLILLGTMLLIGCIPWSSTKAVDPKTEITSGQASKLKKHSRDEVANRLGPPVSEGEHQMVYEWQMFQKSGVLMNCGSGINSTTRFFNRSLVIELDDQGYVKDWNFKNND